MRRAVLPILALMSSAAACTGAGYEPQAEGELSPRVTGVLFIERSEGGAGADVQVGARFLRIVGVSDAVLPDLVGTPTLPRVGACVARVGNTSAVEASDPLRAEVRLLDVGDVDVQAGGMRLQMRPRRFPDLWNVVSGSLYGVEAPMPMGIWRFTAHGSAESGVGAFDVAEEAPEGMMAVRVGELSFPVGAGLVPSLSLGHGLPVRWQRGRGEDRVAIVFEGNGSIVCGANDTGSFDLDANAVERVRDVLRNGGTASVHRMRARPFAAQGLDAATLVFDLAVRARVKVE